MGLNSRLAPLLTTILLVLLVQFYISVRDFIGHQRSASPQHDFVEGDVLPDSSGRAATDGTPSGAGSGNRGPRRSAPETDACRYRVQIYDRDRQFATLKRRELEPIVRGSRGGSTDLQCEEGCTLEVTVADEEGNFTGMDAVLFHLTRYITPDPPPPVDLNPGQAWVFFSWESPWANAGQRAVAALTVNAVWSYHRGSDLTTPFGGYSPGAPTGNETGAGGRAEGPTKLVAWMASNCKDTSWPRMRFVRVLKKYVPVDIYGICGHLKCKPYGSADCNVRVLRQYKFYLSLENSECDEYITEKLWEKPLMQGVVPVVYGPRRSDYEDLLPPNSFIYAGDFRSVKSLASHLRLLDARPELYAEYLAWRRRGAAWRTKPLYGPFEPSLFCNLAPVIERVRRGELARRPVAEFGFSRTCRNSTKPATREFGVGHWAPW